MWCVCRALSGRSNQRETTAGTIYSRFTYRNVPPAVGWLSVTAAKELSALRVAAKPSSPGIPGWLSGPAA